MNLNPIADRSALLSHGSLAVASGARLAFVALTLCLLAQPAEAKREHREAYKSGMEAMATEQYDWAVVHFRRAVDLRPANSEYRKLHEQAKRKASYHHFNLAKGLLATGSLEAAISELQQVVLLNPAHQYAYVELERAMEDWREQRAAEDDESAYLEKAKREAIEAEGSNVPKLDPSSNVRIIWDMEEQKLRDVFKVVKDVANINIIYDEGVRLDDEITFVTDNVSLEEALDLLMLQQGLTYKVYNEHTILVYPDNQTKRREYEDQVIQTFYLSNAEVKDVNALLRGVVDIRKTAVNETLNAITIRDTQDKIAIAGSLIERNDKAKAELIIDMEILEVNRSKLKRLGIDIVSSPGSDGINATIAFDDSQVALNNLRRLNQLGSYTLAPIPSVVVSLVKSDADTRTLARPSARVTDGEKVSLHIGDQVPIPNTSFNTSTTVGSNVVPVTSFTYQNVGIQIDLEPRIHHNREITVKMSATISSVGAVTEGGQPTIGTREITTQIRLRDGETNLLAGLFQEVETESHSGLAGFMKVPWLRKIFGSNSESKQETEIILTVTPHIIRIPDIDAGDMAAMHVGTERRTTLRGESKYGVGGSPFAKPGEIAPPQSVFESLRPGGKTRNVSSLLVPDLDLASGRDKGLSSPVSGSSASGAAPSPRGSIQLAPSQSGSPGAGGSSNTSPPSASPGSSPGRQPSGGGSPSPPPAPGGPPQAVQAGSIAVWLEGPTEVSVGERFDVNVRIAAGAGQLKDAPWHLVFDAPRLDVLSVKEGGFFTDSGLQTVFIPNIQPGRVMVGHSLMGSGGSATGEGTLAVISLRATNTGTATFRLENATFSDRVTESLAVQLSGMSITVRP